MFRGKGVSLFSSNVHNITFTLYKSNLATMTKFRGEFLSAHSAQLVLKDTLGVVVFSETRQGKLSWTSIKWDLGTGIDNVHSIELISQARVNEMRLRHLFFEMCITIRKKSGNLFSFFHCLFIYSLIQCCQVK